MDARHNRKHSTPRRLPGALTPDERHRLLSYPNPRYPTRVRDRAIMAIMLFAGLRVSEALALRPRDVDLRQHMIRVVKGKGDKDRVVPIDLALEPYLHAWKAVRPVGPRFFLSLRGTPLLTSQVRRSVKRYARKAGLEVDVHPHLLRHTAASSWLTERGLNIREVQLLLGHADIRTTEVYLHANPVDIARKLRAV